MTLKIPNRLKISKSMGHLFPSLPDPPVPSIGWLISAHWGGGLEQESQPKRSEEHVPVGGRLGVGSQSRSWEGRAHVQGGRWVWGIDWCPRLVRTACPRLGAGRRMRGARVPLREKGAHRPHTDAPNSKPTPSVRSSYRRLHRGNPLLQQTEIWLGPPFGATIQSIPGKPLSHHHCCLSPRAARPPSRPYCSLTLFCTSLESFSGTLFEKIKKKTKHNFLVLHLKLFYKLQIT